MTVRVVDERQASVNVPTKERYPLGAVVFVRNQSYRAPIVGYGDDENTIVVLRGGRRTPLDVNVNDIVILGTSAEHYTQRVVEETHKIAGEYSVSRNRVDPTLTELATTAEPEQLMLHVVVTTVGHYTVIPSPRMATRPMNEIVEQLGQHFFSAHGEFNYDYFRQVDEPNSDNRTHRIVSITFEAVDAFPPVNSQTT